MRRNSGSGFTLIEVLLALVILAIISSVVYSSFSTAGQSVEHAEAQRDNTDLARTLIARMSYDISNAFCSPGASPALKSKTVFYGKKVETPGDDAMGRTDSLFLTTLTNWRGPNSKEMDLWEVGYFFKEKPEGGGYALMRREKRDLTTDEPPLEGGTEYVITDKVEELRLRYYVGSQWKDAWGSSSPCRNFGQLKAVEISLTIAGGRQYITQVEIPKIQQ